MDIEYQASRIERMKRVEGEGRVLGLVEQEATERTEVFRNILR